MSPVSARPRSHGSVVVGLTLCALVGCAQTQPALEVAAQCDQDVHITIAAVGDLLLHDAIQEAAAGIASDPVGVTPEHDLSAAVEEVEEQLRALYGDQVSEEDLRGAAAYAQLFTHVRSDLSQTDLTVANLEQPLAHGLTAECEEAESPPAGVLWDADNPVYRGEGNIGLPNFNAHPAFALALRSLGIDVVSTANNHAFDRCAPGIDRTLTAVANAGIASVGTVHGDRVPEQVPLSESQREEVDKAARQLVVEVKGVTIAFLAFTYATNKPLAGNPQVSVVNFNDPEAIRGIAREVVAIRARDQTVDFRMSEAGSLEPAQGQPSPSAVDIVIVSLHWGYEYHESPDAYQVDALGLLRNPVLTAEELDDLDLPHDADLSTMGADVVLGHHPHVPQPLIYQAGRERPFAAACSLANFMSGQTAVQQRRAAGILYLDIAVSSATGTARVHDVGFRPTYIATRYEARAGRTVQAHYVIPWARQTPFEFPDENSPVFDGLGYVMGSLTASNYVSYRLGGGLSDIAPLTGDEPWPPSCVAPEYE